MNNKFWNRVEKNKKEVNKWPKWKRNIVINSNTIKSGIFKEDKDEI